MLGRTKKAPPEEYIEYLLLDHFRCLPSELDKEDNERLMQFLWIKGVVAETLHDYNEQQRK